LVYLYIYIYKCCWVFISSFVVSDCHAAIVVASGCVVGLDVPFLPSLVGFDHKMHHHNTPITNTVVGPSTLRDGNDVPSAVGMP
jgi:hypothetical protein